MDKHRTAELLRRENIPGVFVPRQVVLRREDVERHCNLELSVFLDRAEHCDWFTTSDSLTNNGFRPFAKAVLNTWKDLQEKNGLDGAIVVKPLADGCSSGVAIFQEPTIQLPLYSLCLFAGVRELPFSIFFPQCNCPEKLLKLPTSPQREFLIEEFIGSTDGNQLCRYVEITAGVIEMKGRLMCLIPSEVKNDFGILTVDEKFNKGVGVNLTPPPNIAGIQLESIMTRIERVATVLGVQQYARVDAIFDRHENILYILECNTLPGLTAATVLFTQALHTPWLKLAPFEFLNSFITPGLRKMELEADVKGIAEFVSTALPSQLVRDLDGEGEGAHRGIIRVL
jgi:hypothetical protein